MDHLSFSIGFVVALIGLAIIILTLVFYREKRQNYLFTGVVFFVIGVSIVWLGSQSTSTFQINIGITDKQLGLVIISLVMGLFVLKSVFDIREGSQNLKKKTTQPFVIFKSKFQIIVAIIVITWIIFLIVLLLGQYSHA